MLQGGHEKLTDRQTDRQGESNKPPNFVAGGIITTGGILCFTSVHCDLSKGKLGLQLPWQSLHDSKIAVNTITAVLRQKKYGGRNFYLDALLEPITTQFYYVNIKINVTYCINFQIGHVTLMAITETIAWVPYLQIKSLHLIWSLGTPWFHLQGADLQVSCRDSIIWQLGINCLTQLLILWWITGDTNK